MAKRTKSKRHPFEYQKLNGNVSTEDFFKIDKMEDRYLAVKFRYGMRTWNGCVPIISKYQGVNIPETKEDVEAWVLECYAELDPGRNNVWQEEQRTFWAGRKASETQSVFEALNGAEPLTRWKCRKCGPVPEINPQPASRIKQLKKMGYFIATRKKECPNCGGLQYCDLLIRLPRHAADNEKRSPISRKLQNKIKTVLPLRDACFDTPQKASDLIIDHKFPSSRWVNGETVNKTDMSEEDIRKKFQLLTNQTNLQKERYCQECVIHGNRGDFFGIEWYYKGARKWEGTSKADEQGCVGCPWYDLAKWKQELNAFLAKAKAAKK